MKRKVILRIIIITLLGLLGYECYYFSKDLKLENKDLEKVEVVNNFENRNNNIAIMIQDDNYEYKEDTSRTTWPNTTEYTYVGSECVNKDGSDIGDTSSYIDFNEKRSEVTITTKKTIYCTLYFAKGRPALEVLDAKGGEYYGGGIQGNREAVNGLYRFKGTYQEVDNNFICIGGSLNPEKCGSENDNEYLYRIIGVTDGTEANKETSLGLEKGMLKVIKVIPTRTGQQWANDYTTNIDWDHENNIVRTQINGAGFYNGLDEGIIKIISEIYWWKGDNTNFYPSASEIETKTTGQYPIGLMYQSDYYNSGNQDATNWLHISHTMSGKTGTYGNQNEWTMTRYGRLNNYYSAWFVSASGSLDHQDNVTWTSPAIRPVFYLSSKIGLVGNGVENSPYIVTSLPTA